jgi:hypothetical protein
VELARVQRDAGDGLVPERGVEGDRHPAPLNPASVRGEEESWPSEAEPGRDVELPHAAAG